MNINESPYESVSDMTQTVTVAATLNLNCGCAVIHNVGPDKLYFSGAGPATVNSPELASGEKTFPRTGLLYVLSDGTSVLKVEFLDAIS